MCFQGREWVNENNIPFYVHSNFMGWTCMNMASELEIGTSETNTLSRPISCKAILNNILQEYINILILSISITFIWIISVFLTFI